MADRTKILIDCDPGHDDAAAILFAHRHCDLLGITTVHGNSPIENTTRNALAVLELAGIDVPVAQGFSEPIAMKPNFAQHSTSIHGRTGLDGADLPVPRRAPIEAHAVDFLIQTASRHKGELVLAITGPQTNVALAIKREPRFASWLREITIMGGSTTTGNVTPAAEFNIYADPEAASVVFGCGAPIRMVGLNVTRRAGLARADVARMQASGKRLGTAFGGLMDFFLRSQKSVFGLDIGPMHDVLAIVPYAFPDLIDYVETSVRIELAGRYTRGMSVCDMRRAPIDRLTELQGSTSPNARVAVEARSRELIERVVETILSYP